MTTSRRTITPPPAPRGASVWRKKPSSNPFANTEINWPRLITFLCSLIIIIAALVIVFTVIYPQLRGAKDPSPSDSEQPSGAVSQPVSPPSLPAATDPVGVNTDPATLPTQPVDPVVAAPTAIRLNKNDFTLRPGESFQLRATFTPSDWSGTVTWSSTDESLATVSADGNVVHAKPDATGVQLVIITADAGGVRAECKVYIAGPKDTSTSSQAPASEAPVVVTQAPSGGGTVTVGRPGTIVNAEGGLRVRSGPGTTYDILATLLNGNSINVLSDAGGGWYQISLIGSGGTTITGYIMGEYISTN